MSKTEILIFLRTGVDYMNNKKMITEDERFKNFSPSPILKSTLTNTYLEKIEYTSA